MSTSKTGGAAFCVLVDYGTLYVEAGTIYLYTTSTENNAVGLRSNANGKFIMNGGKVHVVATQNNQIGYSTQSLGNDTINGGELRAESANGEAYALYVTGTLNVNGGKFHVTGKTTPSISHSVSTAAKLKIKGGYYNIDTNLDKYIVANYHKKTLSNTHPEYANGYRYTVDNLYTITWKDGTNVIKTDEWAYGSRPSFAYNKPTDAQYTYELTGWSDESHNQYAIDKLPLVTGAATYTAIFNATAREYTITWRDADGSALTPSTTTVQYGVSPTHDAPSKDDCDFAGWKASSSGTVYDGVLPTVGTDEVYAETYTAQYACEQPDIVVDTDEDKVISNNTMTTTTTVHVRGTLEVSGVTLTTDNLILEGTPTSSGEITGDGTVNATQNAYYHLTKADGFKAKTWYAVAVPWQVDVPAYQKANNGVWVKEKDGSGEFVQQELGRTCDLIYYDGARRAERGHDDKCWKYVEFDAKANHIMFPGRAYMIYFLEDIDEIRFVRKAYADLKTTTLAVEAHPSTSGNGSIDAGWNGIANPSTYHAFINPNTINTTYGGVNYGVNYGQLYDGDSWTYQVINLDEDSLVVGQPVYVQVASNNTVTAYANHDGAFPSHLAPRRATANAKPLIQCEVGIAPSEGETTDRVVVRALEDKEDEYVIAQDLMKLGVSTVAPQMWVDRYNSRLCINTIAPTGKKAEYPLNITIPYDGSYTINLLEDLDANASLYLTYNGRAIWNLGYGAFETYLLKGTNTQYGLRIIYNAPQVTTGIDEATIENGEQIRKVLIDEKVYIIRNGEMYSITGAKVQ